MMATLAFDELVDFKRVLSDLRKFLSYESPLKMKKIAFYFILKTLFVLKIFFGHV